MKFLCIGDPHVKQDNLPEIKKLTNSLVENVKKHSPNFVVIMGDLLDEHERALQPVYQHAHDMIEELSKYTIVYLLIGNHDYINATQFQTNSHFFNPLKKWDNVNIIDEFTVHKFKEKGQEFTFGFCPYVPPGRFYDALDGSGENWEFCDCIFAHQEFKGCKMGPIISSIGDDWSDDNPLVISGHIHDHQIVNNVFYTGSIIQHGYTDLTEKFLWMFNFTCDDDEISYDYKGIKLDTRKKKLMKINLEEAKTFDIKKFNDFDLKVEIKLTKDERKVFSKSKKYKEFVDSKINVKFDLINTDAPLLKKGINCKDKGYLEIFKELCENDKLDHVYEEILENVF